MKTVHLYYAQDSACPAERFLQPARFCYEEMKEHGLHIQVSTALADGMDWIGFHGIPPNSAVLVELMKYRRRGAKLLWSLDDDWLSIPDWNPAKLSDDGLAVYDVMREMSDRILCSTETIRRTFWPGPIYGDGKWQVAPNLLDLTTFPTPDYEQAGYVDTQVQFPIRIVWSGGLTHKGDVEFISQAINDLLEKHGSRVAFIFQGLSPPPQLVRNWLHRGVLWQPPVPFAQYRKITNSINPHVWLAPLADIPFNHSKSNLRIMEGWALSAAVVASAVGEYNCIRHGDDGMLVSENTTEAWFEALNKIILDHELRIQMAANGRQRVKQDYDWNKRECRLPWLDFFHTLR